MVTPFEYITHSSLTLDHYETKIETDLAQEIQQYLYHLEVTLFERTIKENCEK